MDTDISSAQKLPCHRPDIRRIFRSQIVHQRSLDTLHPVPLRQIPEEIPDRMVGTVIHDLCNRDTVISLGKGAVLFVHITDELCIVRISPELGRMLPRNRIPDLHPIRKLVEHDLLHVLIVFHDQLQVMKGILDLSRLLLIGQLCLPCIRIFLVEFHRCRLLPFCKDGQFHLLVAACEFRHRIE